MFSEDISWHYVDMPWMSKPYFYSSDIKGLHRAKLSPFQKKFYAKLYRLRIVEQKCFVVGGAKYTEDLKRFHRLRDEYMLLVNNDIKSVVELVDFISEQEEKIHQIEDRQKEIYRENSSRKRKIKTDEQYREYQIWHSLILSPNVNGNIRGDILATISVIPNKTWNNKLDLYWEPGFKANERCMDRFDNVVKWKADYTAEWIKNRLLEKSHTYYEKCNDKKSFWQKIWN